MIDFYKHRNTTWIDLENPTQEEVRSLINSYDLSPLVADELLHPTIRSKVDRYPNYIYLILHFPAAHNVKDGLYKPKEVQEIDFVIGKDFIITTRYNTLDALHEFSRMFEVNSILDKSTLGDHAGFVFFFMIQHFYKGMMDKIENIRSLLADIEDSIFTGKEKQMVLELSRLNRLLLTYKESIMLHKEVLESFETAGKDFFGKEFGFHLRNILGEYYKVHTALEHTKDYLRELRDTNDSLLSTKQNQIMQNLTVVTFVFLPLSLIAGIFGMNAVHMPFIGLDNDFVTILLVMACSALFTFIYFKLKKWI